MVSLENRNQLLQQTVEILTIRLEDAVGEIGRLRASVAVIPAHRSILQPELPADNSRVLLRIRGIGEKTLGLLEQAGIHSLESLAELQDLALDDPNSALFPHRTRIRKQRWVGQARELGRSA